jgi:hypothetical protein
LWSYLVAGKVLWAWLRWHRKTTEFFPDPWRSRSTRAELRKWKEFLIRRALVVELTAADLNEERQPTIVAADVGMNPHPQATDERRAGLLSKMTRGVLRLVGR